MEYINKSCKIKIEWQVANGIGGTAEDFSQCHVALFLNACNFVKVVPCVADSQGMVTAELPESLQDGVYGLELIWRKNTGTTGLFRRSRKGCVFGIDRMQPVRSPQVTIKLKSTATECGPEGMSVYELMLFGEIEGLKSGFTEINEDITTIKEDIETISTDMIGVVKAKEVQGSAEYDDLF